jgi:hypothetical protein
MGPAVAERTAPAADLMSLILANISESEKGKLAWQLSEAIRHGGEAVTRLLQSWVVTIEVRSHPDYAHQFESFVKMVETRELFKGSPFEGSTDLPQAI